jgi:hypothetical protein
MYRRRLIISVISLLVPMLVPSFLPLHFSPIKFKEDHFANKLPFRSKEPRFGMAPA